MATYNYSRITCESGIPMPEVPEYRRGREAKYPLVKMAVGDSFFVTAAAGDTPAYLARLIVQAVSNARRRQRIPDEFRTTWAPAEEQGHAGIRVWRAA